MRERLRGVVGFGCMRLSTTDGRDEERAVEVLCAALDAGARLLDTADVYCRDASDIGHNERLVARALDAWGQDRESVIVATKGGLTRPGGRWVCNGKARHLVAACEASRAALGVECIDLYQLHAVDPRVPFETSVRALAELVSRGWVRAVGLCNVTVGQIERAREIVEVASVQVALGPNDDSAFRKGVVAYCLEHEIPLLAHSPFGGPKKAAKLMRDGVLASAAEACGVSPAAVALAWIRGLSEWIVPLPGATRIASAREVAAVSSVELGEQTAGLDEHFPAAAIKQPRTRPPDDVDGEVVLLMGIPAAGKSTLVEGFVSDGYTRFNRDARGGTLVGLVRALDESLASGTRRCVLDNTYPERAQRDRVIEVAWKHGLPVRCVWLTTSLKDAQINAARRMLTRHGRLVGGKELDKLSRSDPGMFRPTAQFRYRNLLEPPSPNEGFSAIEERPFVRQPAPDQTAPGLIVKLDGVVWRGRDDEARPSNADDLVLVDGALERLREARDEGRVVCGTTWQPDIDKGTRTEADLEGAIARLRERLALDLDVVACPHAAGPPRCWCRKPLPGMGVVLIDRHGLDPAQTLYVGTAAADRTWAERLGFSYADARDWLSG